MDGRDGMSEVCRSCKQPIRWAVTAGGQYMPIDRDPVVDGNLRLERKPADLPRVVVVPPSDRVDDERLFVAHFRTCEHPDVWKKP
jgi:hypothetical protein